MSNYRDKTTHYLELASAARTVVSDSSEEVISWAWLWVYNNLRHSPLPAADIEASRYFPHPKDAYLAGFRDGCNYKRLKDGPVDSDDEWISIHSRLPDEQVSVLFRAKYGGGVKRFYRNGGVVCDDYGNQTPISDFTHWKKVPV